MSIDASPEVVGRALMQTVSVTPTSVRPEEQQEAVRQQTAPRMDFVSCQCEGSGGFCKSGRSKLNTIRWAVLRLADAEEEAGIAALRRLGSVWGGRLTGPDGGGTMAEA